MHLPEITPFRLRPLSPARKGDVCLILTLSPYRQERTAVFFGATSYMVKWSRELKRKHGVLPQVQAMSRGRNRITDDIREKVRQFHESDEVSRVCPGQKDCISVRDSHGTEVKTQKRLVLGNLREIYELYRSDDKNPVIGFSTFAELCPLHCVLAGSSGTHSVCVCTYQQNPILFLSALGFPGVTCDDLMDFAVCGSNNRDGMMGECENSVQVRTGLRIFVYAATR